MMCAQLASARRRDVANDVRDLVREPERNQLGIEAEALGLRIRGAGEMLETHERDALSFDDELTRVRGADADHEHDVDVAVHGEQLAALLLGVSRERDDVDAVEHRRQIRSTGGQARSHDVHEMRTIGIDDVVVPVGFENLLMSSEVALVSGEAIGAVENSKKVRQQIDQHSTRTRGGRRDA